MDLFSHLRNILKIQSTNIKGTSKWFPTSERVEKIAKVPCYYYCYDIPFEKG